MRRTTSVHHRTVRVAGVVAVALVVGACGKPRSGGAGGTAPFEAFVPGEYRPPIKAPVVPAPDGLKKPWRVEMRQTDPLPFKTPTWKSIPFDRAGELEMPAGSAFRCLYNPVRIQGTSDESYKQVTSWLVLREVWCSSDGWRTHSATALAVLYDGSGAPVRGLGDQADLVLSEVIAGRATTISILLRADPGTL